MKTNLTVGLVIAIAATLFGVGALAEEENVRVVVADWVADDGNAIAIHERGGNMFFGEDDGEVLDVSELRDGETRIVGIGAKQVTVFRSGDAVTISRPANGDDKALEVACSVGQDTCQIITFDDEPDKVMIMVQKTRSCVNGAGDCDFARMGHFDHLGADGNQRMMIKRIECGDHGDCSELHEVLGNRSMTVDLDIDGEGPHAIFMQKGFGSHGQNVLSCPEGDATMHVTAEEADDVFLCPKHSVPMEKMDLPKFIQRIHIDSGEEE